MAAQKAVYAWVHGNPALNNGTRTTPVYNLTLGDRANTSRVGNLSGYTDFYSSHIYPELGRPAVVSLGSQFAGRQCGCAGKGRRHHGSWVLTQPDPISPDQATVAKYDLEFLLDAYKAGVSRTYLFELIDEYTDPNGTDRLNHYGLFNADGTPKLAATAIHNFMSLLDDAGAARDAFTPGSLSYSLSGMPASGVNTDDGSWVSGGNDLLMQRSDGTFVLALWNEQKAWHWDWRNPSDYHPISVPPVPVTLHLLQSSQSIQVFDPLASSTTPNATFANAKDVSLSLPDHPILIVIKPDTGKISSGDQAAGELSTKPVTVGQ